MVDATDTRDGEVLRLRSSGRTFARISRDLEFERPLDAQRAFKRAVHRLPSDQQDQVRQQETSRLDRLAARVNADTDGSDEDRARRLVAIERLRGLLVTES
jgi:AraC-like DNA-binding protein